MASKIQWTEETWNPVIGCAKVSAGCKNCYAEKMSIRLSAMHNKCSPDYASILRYAQNGRSIGFDGTIKLMDSRLTEPNLYRKSKIIFVNSMSDLFHPDISFEFIAKVWDTMFDHSFNEKGCRVYHIFQILTKRPKRMWQFLNWMRIGRRETNYGNIWLGISIENNKVVPERLEWFSKIEHTNKFYSFEPLLEFVYITPNLLDNGEWFIFGCESGTNKRNCELEWIEEMVICCKNADKKVFVKQLNINGKVIHNIEQFPKHLQIREYPF